MPLHTPKDENAAARLWRILTAAKGLQGGTTHAQLAAVFGLKVSDEMELHRSLLAATEAVDEIEWRVRRIPNQDYDLYLHSLPEVRKALTAAHQNFDFNQWKAANLKDDYINPLMYCASLLSKVYPEEEVKQDELQQFLEEINELYESVMSSELDSEIKLIILEQLRNIQQAVHEYRVKGVYPLKKALSTAFGEIILHKQEFQEAVDKKDGGQIAKFLGVLKTLDKITFIATKSKELLLPLVTQYVPLLLEKAKEHFK
jgi:hypothetical protein